MTTPDPLPHAVALTLSRIGPSRDDLAAARFDGRVLAIVVEIAGQAELAGAAASRHQDDLEARLHGWIDEALTRPAGTPPRRRLVPIRGG